MGEERLELSERERERLKVLHEVQRGQLRQVEAGWRLKLSVRQVRRVLRRLEAEGDGGLIHRLRGRRSNRKFSRQLQDRVLSKVRRRYSDFGPTLASEHLADDGLHVNRETLRQWMSQAGLWRPRRRRLKAVHTWRPRRASFGELVMADGSPFDWLEGRGPELNLIAMIDDATSRLWAWFDVTESTQAHMVTLKGWLKRFGRPVALYTDKHSIFKVNRPPDLNEQLAGEPAQTQFARALRELDIEWIAAHSPQAKGRVERLFATLQDRLVKQMRLARICSADQANQFLDKQFLPKWNERFTEPARRSQDAHRPLRRTHHLEAILSLRHPRTVANDYTVHWHAQRWAIPRAEVQAGLRGARAEVEQRLDGSVWLRFRGRYLTLVPCRQLELQPALAAQVRAKPKPKCKPRNKKHIPPPDHPWRRTFLSSPKPDISILR
jgi:hypothetical protein